MIWITVFLDLLFSKLETRLVSGPKLLCRKKKKEKKDFITKPHCSTWSRQQGIWGRLTHFTSCVKQDNWKWGEKGKDKKHFSSYLHSEVVELLVLLAHLHKCHRQPLFNALAEVTEPNIHISRHKLKHWRQRVHVIPTDKHFHERELHERESPHAIGLALFHGIQDIFDENLGRNTVEIHFALVQ